MAFRENHLDPELVVIEEWDAPVVGAALTLALASNAEVEGAVATVQATLSASPTPTGDLVVTLSSDESTVTVPASATIPANQSQTTFDVTIADDNTDTGNRTAVITATDGGGVYAADNDTLAITDDDTVLPAVAWASASQTVSEEDIVATIAANLTFAPTTQVTVPYTVTGTATSGVDHDLADGTLTFEIDDTQERALQTPLRPG